jgi:hypothetical protein
MNVLRQFREDGNVPIGAVQSELGVTPPSCQIGRRQALGE